MSKTAHVHRLVVLFLASLSTLHLLLSLLRRLFLPRRDVLRAALAVGSLKAGLQFLDLFGDWGFIV